MKKKKKKKKTKMSAAVVIGVLRVSYNEYDYITKMSPNNVNTVLHNIPTALDRELF